MFIEHSLDLIIQKEGNEFIEYNVADQSHMRIENEGYASNGDGQELRESSPLEDSSQR
jgi:hypothetical protein